MTISVDDRTLLIRSINAARKTYFPSYVGLKLLANQLPKGESRFLSNAVVRRLTACDRWRFRTFKSFKGAEGVEAGANYNLAFRDCFASSPFTAFAEATILAELSNCPSFSASPRTYSYHWPTSNKSGSSYRFFAEGYKSRNIEINAALESPGTVAIVTDLKGFYPSIQRSIVERELKERLNSSRDHLTIPPDAIFNFLMSLFEIGGKGVPIGPESSHVLGNLALVQLDKVLHEQHGCQYFRYVDDLVIVCREEQAKNIYSQIASIVEGHGFNLNADKTAFFSASQWRSNVMRPDTEGNEDFRQFAQDLTTFLALRPDKANSLRNGLSDGGLSLPITRLEALSTYSRFKYFLGRRKAEGGVARAARLYLHSEHDFVERGLRLKETYENALTAHLNTTGTSTASERRWCVQRVRRIVNVLFYLRRFDEWAGAAYIFDIFPELVEQKALAIALHEGIVDEVLPFYPKAPNAFAELWQECRQEPAKLRDIERALQSPVAVDSLINLGLNGVISADIFACEGLRGVGRTFLGCREQRGASVRSHPNLSFDDEIESLGLGMSADEITRLAKMRYAYGEVTVFEALTLLSNEYRS